MRRPLTALFALLIAIAASAPAQLDAQVRFGGVEAWAGYGGWSGDDLGDLRVGLRGGGTVLLQLSEGWRFGVGGYFGETDYPFADTITVRTQDAKEFGADLVVRRIFGNPSSAQPFVALHGGWTRLTADPVDGSATRSQNGVSFGPEAGITFEASRDVNVLFGGGFTLNRYADTRIFGAEEPGFGEASSAVRWSVRIALILGAPR